MGRAVVIADRPSDLMGAVCKAWKMIERRVRTERSMTLDPDRIQELQQEIAYMQSVRFSTKPVRHSAESAVLFMKPDQDIELPPTCHTLYVTVPMSIERLAILTAWMLRRRLVVVYD
jgi:hypothetical protein